MVGRLAQAQHGVVSRGQLLQLGVSPRAIGGRIERGAWHVLHRGTYAVGHRVLSAEGRWMAAALACGPEAVLSHRSAAQLWRLRPRSIGLVEVTRPHKFRSRAGIRAHRSRLPVDEIEEVDGIPVTSVSRTLLDLGTVLARHQLEQAINEAEVLGLTDRSSLPDLLKRYPGRRGSGVIRALLRDEVAARGVTRSELEERFAALIDAHRLPRPRLNASVAVRGSFPVVDCLWERERLIVELDGRAAHGTSRAFEADRERDRLLAGAGWRVIRLTWRQLRDDGPAIAAELRAMLRDAGAQVA